MNKSFSIYVVALLTVALCTVIGFALYPYVVTSNLIMIYLLAVVVIAACQSESYGPAIVTALISGTAFDFFFTMPRFSFDMQHSSDIITLFVMFVVAQVISHLTIHVRKHAEQVKVAQMETETERFRNLLLSSISHDLRTPLSSIMGAASLFLSKNNHLDKVMQQELAQDIYNESDRLNRLVNNILQLVKLGSPSFELKKQLNSIEDVIGSALNTLERSLGDRKVFTKIAPHLPLIMLDPILIEKVIHNIIENAIKFSPVTSPIEISATLQEKKVLICIQDCGAGIDSKDIDKIFVKFYQSKKSHSGGIGLGLAICKDIIKAHGGEIWVENRPEKGASFCFTLPYME